MSVTRCAAKAAQGFPNRRAADLEQLDQVQLGEQAISGVEFAGGDEVAELLDDAARSPRERDGVERPGGILDHPRTSRIRVWSLAHRQTVGGKLTRR